MAWKDNRNLEFKMLETAAFDPIWTEFNWDREGRCTVPCIRDYGAVFKGKAGAIKDEWESYDGPQLDAVEPQRKELRARAHDDDDEIAKHNECRTMRIRSRLPLTRKSNCATRASWPITFLPKINSHRTIARSRTSSVERGHIIFTTK
jgi:hypothetical protein